MQWLPIHTAQLEADERPWMRVLPYSAAGMCAVMKLVFLREVWMHMICSLQVALYPNSRCSPAAVFAATQTTHWFQPLDSSPAPNSAAATFLSATLHVCPVCFDIGIVGAAGVDTTVAKRQLTSCTTRGSASCSAPCTR